MAASLRRTRPRGKGSVDFQQMPLVCAYKAQNGRGFCATDCPAQAPCGVFETVRVERPEQLPEPGERTIDVAVLDMNHGWP
ncbi:MAG TPA: hypothetical protein VEQ10_12100, partial [Vicinamibacteria bacterium]|nr:hypothetical protein [Vicinamibacteria bacterium]